jgi:hypothetical protein
VLFAHGIAMAFGRISLTFRITMRFVQTGQDIYSRKASFHTVKPIMRCHGAAAEYAYTIIQTTVL